MGAMKRTSNFNILFAKQYDDLQFCNYTNMHTNKSQQFIYYFYLLTLQWMYTIILLHLQ